MTDPLTDALNAKAIAFINAKHLCPHCLTGALLEGPHGGCSIMVRCQSCEHEFNFSFAGGVVFMAEKIPDHGPKGYPSLLVWPAPVEELKTAAEEKATKGGIGLGVDKHGHLLICVRENDGREYEMRMLDVIAKGPAPGQDAGPVINGLAEVLTHLVLHEGKKQITHN